MNTFKSGEFVKYQAAVAFAIGPLERTAVIGEIVDFDGTKVKFEGDDKVYTMPNFKGCVQRGWLQPAGQEIVPVRPQSAGIRPRPAIADSEATMRPMTHRFQVDPEENQVVSKIGGFQDPRGQAEVGRNQDFRGQAQVGNPPRTANTAPQSFNSGGFEVVNQEADEVVVSEIDFTGGGAQVTGGDFDGGAGGEIVKTSNADARDAISQTYKESTARQGQPSHKRSEMADMDPDELAAEREARVGLAEEQDARRKANVAEPQYLFEEDSPTRKRAAKKKVTKKVSKKKISKIASQKVTQSSENFEWSTKGHWKTREKKAMEYKDDPVTMGKIIAAETPAQSAKILTAWNEYRSRK